MPSQRVITLEELSKFFHLPEKAVARQLGVCLTSLKKLCRHHGIHRWPYRKLKSIEKKIEKLEGLMQNPSEDAHVLRSKLSGLTEEKKRLPFTGTPSCAYGGVRRSRSSPTSVMDASSCYRSECQWSSSSGSPGSPSSMSASETPRSVSPCSFVTCSSGNSKLAAKLRAVGSLSEHRQRLVTTTAGFAWDAVAVNTEDSCESDYGYTSAEDLTEQPEDEPEEGVLSGDLAGPLVFDMANPLDSVFGDGVDISALAADSGYHDTDVGYDDALGEVLCCGPDDFFSAHVF